MSKIISGNTGRTRHKRITAPVLFSVLMHPRAGGVCGVLCAGLLVVQAVRGPTVAGCFFPALGIVSELFYLAVTRCGK